MTCIDFARQSPVRDYRYLGPVEYERSCLYSSFWTPQRRSGIRLQQYVGFRPEEAMDEPSKPQRAQIGVEVSYFYTCFNFKSDLNEL